MSPKPTRLFVQVRLIEELDLNPGRKMSYKAYRTLDRVDLTDVPTIEDGEGWLKSLADTVTAQLEGVKE
jgi:hypothetical protein